MKTACVDSPQLGKPGRRSSRTVALMPDADAALKVDQARLITHHAARLFDAGRPAAKEAAMAKLAASEAASFAADACVKTLGGYGYSPEYPAEVAPRLEAPRAVGRHQRHHAPDRRPRIAEGLMETAMTTIDPTQTMDITLTDRHREISAKARHYCDTYLLPLEERLRRARRPRRRGSRRGARGRCSRWS